MQEAIIKGIIYGISVFIGIIAGIGVTIGVDFFKERKQNFWFYPYLVSLIYDKINKK